MLPITKLIDRDEFSFVIKEKMLTVRFNKDNITLQEDDKGEMFFDDLKQFKLFCNTITDIIEFYENSKESKNV